MGQAWRAPSPTYERHYYITDKAVTRLRELLGSETTHKSDDEIRNVLDEAVREQADSGKGRQFDFQKGDEVVKQTAYDLIPYFGEALVAIVAPNEAYRAPSRKVEPPTEAIVIVAPKTFLAGLDKREEATFGDLMNRDELGSLISKMKKEREPSEPATISSVPNINPPEHESPKHVQGSSKEEWVVTYLGAIKDTVMYDTVLKDDVPAYMQKLISIGVKTTSIKVYKPVKLNISISIEE